MRISSLAFIVLFFISCAKTNQQKIVGTWQIERVEIKDGYGFVYYDTTFDSQNTNFLVSQDSMKARIDFEYSPLGNNFQVLDSLILSTQWKKSGDLIQLANNNFSLKIELFSKNQLVFNYYDYSNYRLKTFFLRKK